MQKVELEYGKTSKIRRKKNHKAASGDVYVNKKGGERRKHEENGSRQRDEVAISTPKGGGPTRQTTRPATTEFPYWLPVSRAAATHAEQQPKEERKAGRMES